MKIKRNLKMNIELDEDEIIYFHWLMEMDAFAKGFRFNKRYLMLKLENYLEKLEEKQNEPI